jgi:phenylpropionate dioxygenase-like ring-hydroxylating dioxygenase large terminal subunit
MAAGPGWDGRGGACDVPVRGAGAVDCGVHQAAFAERFGILAQVAPVDEEFSEMRMVMAMNYGHEIPEQELIAFQDLVAGQDRAIVESQRPELLPLDLQAELHLRSDRMAIAYRKWLREIGFTYGVA